MAEQCRAEQGRAGQCMVGEVGWNEAGEKANRAGGAGRGGGAHLHPTFPLLRLLSVEQSGRLHLCGAGPARHREQREEDEGEAVTHVLFPGGGQHAGAVRHEEPEHDSAEFHAARGGEMVHPE